VPAGLSPAPLQIARATGAPFTPRYQLDYEPGHLISSAEVEGGHFLSVQGQPSQDELVARAFSHAAEYAQLYSGCNPTSDFFNERLQRVLESLASVRAGRVLDVGCGPGALFPHLAKHGQFALFGVDRSLEMIRQARALPVGITVDLAVGGSSSCRISISRST